MHWRPAPAAHHFDDVTDRVDDELRLLLVYLVAAVRVGDVFRVRHEVGELFLGLFLRGVGDVTEIRWNASREFAFSDHRRDLRPPGTVGRQDDQGKRT